MGDVVHLDASWGVHSRLRISRFWKYDTWISKLLISIMLVIIRTLGQRYKELVWTQRRKPPLHNYGKMGMKGFGLSKFIIYPLGYKSPFVYSVYYIGCQPYIGRECFLQDTILYMGYTYEWKQPVWNCILKLLVSNWVCNVDDYVGIYGVQRFTIISKSLPMRKIG